MLRVFSVRGNDQRLDGGAMFGNAPRAVWQKWCPPDERGRISLACRAALIEDGTRRILLETGVGAFFDPKLRDRFGVEQEEHVLLGSLARLGVRHEDIDVVVLSHLHFDHAGGLLARYVEGAPHRLLFPNATFVVSSEALARARAPHLRDRASFIDGLDRMLEESGRLEVVQLQDEGSTTSKALGPRFELAGSFGHTPGMLHTTAIGETQRLFFAADLIPGAPWVHLPITMGYDRYPERLIDEKHAFLERFVANETRLFFTHDAKVASAKVQRDERGRFAAIEALDDAAAPIDLDA